MTIQKQVCNLRQNYSQRKIVSLIYKFLLFANDICDDKTKQMFYYNQKKIQVKTDTKNWNVDLIKVSNKKKSLILMIVTLGEKLNIQILHNVNTIVDRIILFRYQRLWQHW